MSIKSEKQKEFNVTIGLIQDNLALTLLALNEHFGMGQKRINDFLDQYEKLVIKYSGYDNDGVSKDKLKQGLKDIGIEPNRIYERVPSLNEIRPKKQNLTLAETIEISEKLKAMQDFMKGSKTNA